MPMFKEDTNHEPEGIKGTACSNKCKTAHTEQETNRSLGLFPEKMEGLSAQDPHFPSRTLKPLKVGNHKA